jgi:hypothetical protein
MEKQMSQDKIVLSHLEKGPMTALDAVNLSILRLASRIYTLRKEGHKISSRLVPGKKKGTWYSEYTMEAK